jgi:hypothetical protein
VGKDTAVEVMPKKDEEVEVLEVDTFDTAEYDSKAIVLVERVQLVKIETVDQYQSVAQAGLEAASNIKALEAYIGPLKDRRYREWKRVCDLLTEKTKDFVSVKTKAGQLVAAYQEEEQRKQKAAEDAERIRLQKEDEERRAREAEQLASEGRVSEGVAVLEAPTVVAEPIMASPSVPKVAGIGAPRQKYFAKVVSNDDLKKLAKAVVDGKVPVLAIRPTCKSWECDDTWLDKRADSDKELLDIPGVTLGRKSNTTFRTK